MIKVAIVEDDTGVREGLTFVVNGTAGFRGVGSYANAGGPIYYNQQSSTGWSGWLRLGGSGFREIDAVALLNGGDEIENSRQSA